MRFDLPELPQSVFETQIEPRWADMDALGHINGVRYLRYLEETRMQWLARVKALPDPTVTGPVLVNAFCSYHREAVYPTRLRAQLYIGKMGRSSVDTYTTLRDSDDDGILYASGGATIVWMDFVAGASVPLPDWLKRLPSL